MGGQFCDHSNDFWLNLNMINRLEINLSNLIKINKIVLFNEMIAPIEDNKFQQ